MVGVKRSNNQRSRASSPTGFVASGAGLVFRVRWYASAAVVAAIRILRLRTQDLDQLFPWVLFSLFANLIIWIFLLFGLAGQLPQKNPVNSLVEISLTPRFRPPHVTPPSLPALPSPDGLVPTHPQRVSAPVATADRQAAFNAYLKSWESRIMDLAQKKLFGNRHGPLPKGRIVVAVTIAPSGQLMAINLVQGSGNIVLAAAVETIIREATPFPPLPAQWQSPPTPLRIVRTWSFE